MGTLHASSWKSIKGLVAWSRWEVKGQKYHEPWVPTGKEELAFGFGEKEVCAWVSDEQTLIAAPVQWRLSSSPAHVSSIRMEQQGSPHLSHDRSDEVGTGEKCWHPNTKWKFRQSWLSNSPETWSGCLPKHAWNLKWRRCFNPQAVGTRLT